MEIKEEQYYIFWKPEKERVKELLKVYNETGMLICKLIDNFLPFPEINLN